MEDLFESFWEEKLQCKVDQIHGNYQILGDLKRDSESE
jgi:hypothetical protein